MTMERDCVDYVRKSHKCQIHGDKINALLVSLFNMVLPYSFAIRGIDVITPINRKAKK
jgi:hypothetical protein